MLRLLNFRCSFCSNPLDETHGSFARGEQTPNSDIDLRLVCGNAMTFGTLYELSHELERELGRKVEIVTNPPEHMRPAFRKSIKQEEIRLYVST